MGFVADLPERVILDEIQRVPELFEALKMEVDRRLVPGRFILTGSTNVLLIPTLSESLAVRMQIIRLHPLAQQELAARSALSDSYSGTGFLSALFGDGFGAGIDQPGTRTGVSRPGGHQSPAQQGDRAGAVLLNPAGGEVLPGRAVVARFSIGRQRRCPHTVQVTNLIRGQLLGDPAAHRRFLKSVAVAD